MKGWYKLLENEKRELIDKISKYGELKSSLGKSEHLKWKNPMTEEVIEELTIEKDILLSNIIDIIKEL